MKMGASCSVIALICFASASLVHADESPLAAFNRTIGDWSVAGDPVPGGCVAFRNNADRSKLTMALRGVDETVRFSISNNAWRSMEDGEQRLRATFLDKKGQITDLWDLSVTGTSAANGGPRFVFETTPAANDDASFLDEFKAGSELWFWRGTVPVASFNLTGSSAVVEALLQCRATLQIDENFDPFAK